MLSWSKRNILLVKINQINQILAAAASFWNQRWARRKELLSAPTDDSEWESKGNILRSHSTPRRCNCLKNLNSWMTTVSRAPWTIRAKELLNIIMTEMYELIIPDAQRCMNWSYRVLWDGEILLSHAPARSNVGVFIESMCCTGRSNTNKQYQHEHRLNQTSAS